MGRFLFWFWHSVDVSADVDDVDDDGDNDDTDALDANQQWHVFWSNAALSDRKQKAKDRFQNFLWTGEFCQNNLLSGHFEGLMLIHSIAVCSKI